MKNWYKSIVILSLMLVWACPIEVNAAETASVQPQAENDKSTSVTLTITDETATCTTTVIGLSGTSSISIGMELQKYVNGTWKTYAEWENSTSSIRLTLSEDCAVSTGTYRIYTTCTVVRNGVSETYTVTSGQKTCN